MWCSPQAGVLLLVRVSHRLFFLEECLLAAFLQGTQSNAHLTRQSACTLGTGRPPQQTMHGTPLTIKSSLCAWPDHLLPSCSAWVFEQSLLMNSTGCGTQHINGQRMFRWMCGGRGKAEIQSQGADGWPTT